MVIENLTQRYNEFHQELDNILTVEDQLQNKNVVVHLADSKRKDGQDRRPQNYPKPGSIRSISHWLDKDTETVMRTMIFFIHTLSLVVF